MRRHHDRNHFARPIDAGTGRICASFAAASGAWLAVGTCHSAYGFIEFSALPPFDAAERGIPAAARRYREMMLDPRYGCVRVEVDGDLNGDTLRQSWSIRAARHGRPRVVLSVGGRIDRPALAEITEVDPPPPTGAVTTVTITDDGLVLAAPRLPAVARVTIAGCAVAWRATPDHHVAELRWPSDVDELTFVIGITFGVSPAKHRVPSGVEVPVPAAALRASNGADRLTVRAIAYVRACTALSVAPDERVILADHRILPLSWTRDAYWQALLLLAADGRDDRRRVADHLRWLWRRCERPDGRWVRSHHANGQRKDRAFQADQQLYPIVELADFWRLTGALRDGVDWSDAVATAWSAALAEVDPDIGLIASAENAADDPAPMPYIGASQILLWYCAWRLAELADTGGLAIDADAVRRVGRRVADAFNAHLLRGADGWANATDGRNRRSAYHDANDLPVALAPVWGFCGADDPGWVATMEFAMSPENPGFVDGDRPGLGSAHTAGPWTLGDIQSWIHGLVTGDHDEAAAALARLDEVAYADGMLPEAYTATGPLERVRHSFAWPGAALAALRLLGERERGDGLRRLHASR